MGRSQNNITPYSLYGPDLEYVDSMAEPAPSPAVNGAPAQDQPAPANGTTNGSVNQTATAQEPFSWLKPHVHFVVILVGPDEVPFSIHLDFIRARSTFFKDHFNANETENIEHVVRLKDTLPEIFGYAQNFLFTGEVVPESGEMASYETLIGLWKLGHALGIDGLCDKTLSAMVECRRTTGKIPATPLLVQVWQDTPEGSSLRKLLLTWAAEYMRSSDGRQEFARSLPQEVLSELVVTMSSLEAQPSVQGPPAPAHASSEPAPRKSVHYLEEGSDDERREKKSRRVSGPTAPSSAPLTPLERKPPANRKFVKAAHPKRRSSGAVLLADGEITTEKKVEFCADLLDRMLSGPGFWTRLVGPFKDPVDPHKDQVPDYFEKVKNPMDLMTIKAKMDRHEYTTEDEFSSDVRQIFDNCYTYWKRGDPMWAACEKFQKTFEDKYSQMTKHIAKLMREPVE